jgi:hypothetical protein
VVEIATEVARRVDEEDPSAGEETFAAALIRGLLGDPTEELLAVTVLNLCALEWPFNEQGVRDFLPPLAPAGSVVTEIVGPSRWG